MINGESLVFDKFGIVTEMSGYYLKNHRVFGSAVNFFPDNTLAEIKDLQPNHFMNYNSKKIHICRVDNRLDNCFGTYFTADGYKKGELSNGKLNGYGCYFRKNNYNTCGKFKDDEAYEGIIFIGINRQLLYEGSIMNTKPNGTGKLLIGGNELFIGKFFEGNLLSPAIGSDAKLGIYQGDFNNLKKNGSGKNFDWNCSKIAEQIWKDDQLVSDKSRSVSDDEYHNCIELRHLTNFPPYLFKWLPSEEMENPYAAVNPSTYPDLKDFFQPSDFEFD